MSQTTNAITTMRDHPASTELPVPQMLSFVQTAGIVTKLFFAALSGLGGIAAFCVGIAFTPFSPQTGIASFAIGTSLFGFAGILLFASLKPQTEALSPRQFVQL